MSAGYPPPLRQATVTFFTSDVPGKYGIKVTAFSKESAMEENPRNIVVK